MTHSPSQKELLAHLARLEGQLRAVRVALESHDPDCQKASTTLAAASRSFASLRASFVTCMLTSKFLHIPKGAKGTSELESVLRVIKS